jgi:hypothetical protein
LPVIVNVHAFALLPPLEQAPDQIASRPFVTLSVIDVPVHLGFEALAEDLEGLWTPNEATRALGRTGFLMRVSMTRMF